MTGKTYTLIKFFLQEHIMLVSHSIRSQDVFCIGDRAETKEERDAPTTPSVAIESLPVDLTGQMLIEFERSNSANKATLGYRAAAQAGREEPNPPSAPTHRT